MDSRAIMSTTLYKRFILLGCIGIFSAGLVACDQEHVKDYYVTNAYAEPVAVSFIKSNGETIETIVPLHETVLIYSQVYVFGTVGVSDDRDALYIRELTVTHEDEVRTIAPANWTYKKLNKYHADYRVTIDTALFEN